jgi:hypothetical protein
MNTKLEQETTQLRDPYVDQDADENAPHRAWPHKRCSARTMARRMLGPRMSAAARQTKLNGAGGQRTSGLPAPPCAAHQPLPGVARHPNQRNSRD